MCTNARRQGCCKARVLSSGSRAGELHPARHKCPLLRCVPCAPQQDAAGALKKCELALCVSSPLSGSATHKSDRCGIIRALRAQAHKQRWHDSKARRRFSTQRYAQSACCRADIWIELHSNLPARGQNGRWYERHDPPGGGDEEQCYDWPCSHPPALPRGFADLRPLRSNFGFRVTSPEAGWNKSKRRSEKDGDARTYAER